MAYYMAAARNDTIHLDEALHRDAEFLRVS